MIKTKREINNIWNTNPFAIAWRSKLSIKRTINKNMKLYEIPRQSKIYEEVSDGSSYFTYDHEDGMYSYCVSEKGAVVHLYIGTPMVEYKDGYKIKR